MEARVIRATLLPRGITPRTKKRLALLLARTGLAFEFVDPENAALAIVYGEPPALEGRLPVLQFPDVGVERGDGLWRAAVAKVLDALAANEPLLRCAQGSHFAGDDLPAVAEALLDGWDEDGAELDSHERFAPGSSLLAEHGLLDRPVVEEIAAQIHHAIATIFPTTGTENRAWHYCATLDIDSAGMFNGRAAFRHFLRVLCEFPRNLPAAASEALRTKAHLLTDPHLRIRVIAETLEGMEVPSTFLVQTHRRHQLDSYDLRRAKPIVAQLKAVLDNKYHEVGLHSSYATPSIERKSHKFFAKQWRRLRKVLGYEIANVHRAHYFRIPPGLDYTLPKFFHEIVDSSLGFGSRHGWRRGSCWPHRAAPHVVELAPAAMDTQFRFFEKRTPQIAFETLVDLMESTAKAGGALVVVWHPNHMEKLLSPGWADVFYDAAREAKRRGAVCETLGRTALALQARIDRMERQLNTLP